MTAREVPIAEIIPATSITLDDTEFVTDAVIVAVVAATSGDGKPRLAMQTTPGMSWITQVGLLQSAVHICTHDIESTDVDEEDDL